MAVDRRTRWQSSQLIVLHVQLGEIRRSRKDAERNLGNLVMIHIDFL